MLTALRKNKINYLFLLPAIILVIAVMIYPSFYAAYLSTLHIRDGEVTHFTGLENYRLIFQEENFRTAVKNTFKYMGFFFPMQIIFSLVIAQLIATRIKGAGFFRTGFFLPCVVPIILGAIIWMWIFNGTTGPLNVLLYRLGLDVPIKKLLVAMGSNRIVAMQWFIDKNTALFCNAIIGVWATMGFSILILLGGINSIPTEVEEAALLDGAIGLTKFRRITLPLIKDSLALVVMTSIIGSVKVFSQIYATTKGGPGDATLVLYYYFYKLAFTGSHELGKASAAAVIMTFFILFLNYINFKYVRTRTGER